MRTHRRFALLLGAIVSLAALPQETLAQPAPIALTESLKTHKARTEQKALCMPGGAFPQQWTWDAADTVPRPRAALAADGLTPRIEQYRAGQLIATWHSLGSDPATCSFGNPSATEPVDLQAAADSGCGPFGNVSHVDLWNTMQNGDEFHVHPAVYTGPVNNIVLIAKPDHETGPAITPRNITIRGIARDGIRPAIVRSDDGQGDFATAQGAVYVADGINITLQGIDVALGAGGSVNKAGIYVNGARNLTLRDMRIHDFARQGNGADGQNGVFVTPDNRGTLKLRQVEAFNNGGPNGPTHNFYINASATDPDFTVHMLHSWSHDAVYGHAFKSRAQVHVIEGNYFAGGLPNTAEGQTQAESYLLDLPNGSRATIRDNIFVKNASGLNSNGMSITFAMEGFTDARPQSVAILNNTFVAFTQFYDGLHPVYPLSFFYPNRIPGRAKWPANVAYDIRNNVYAGYCPTPADLRSGNYRGDLALTVALSELNRDFSLKKKYVPADDAAIVGAPEYGHVTRKGGRRDAATMGARD